MVRGTHPTWLLAQHARTEATASPRLCHPERSEGSGQRMEKHLVRCPDASASPQH